MRNKTDTHGSGFAGQIVTNQYDKLKRWAITEPKPEQNVLEGFLRIAARDYKIKTLNTNHSSYGLKHCVERVSNALVEAVHGYQYEYIGNEDFIIAALQHGFDVKNCSEGRGRLGPNYYFNLSEKMFTEKNFAKIVEELAVDVPRETTEETLAREAKTAEIIARFK